MFLVEFVVGLCTIVVYLLPFALGLALFYFTPLHRYVARIIHGDSDYDTVHYNVGEKLMLSLMGFIFLLIVLIIIVVISQVGQHVMLTHYQ